MCVCLMNNVLLSLSLSQTYFPAFRACVEEGGVGSIMCSYNAVNGIPSCVDDNFNNKIVRGKWKFDGYLVSHM